MDRLIPGIFLVIFVGGIASCCGLFQGSARITYQKFKPEIHYNFESAKSTTKKDLLFLVHPDGDTAAFDSTIRQVFELQRNCEDATYYHVICRDFAVVKIYRSDLDALAADTVKYPRPKITNMFTILDTLDRKKPCLFIGGPNTMYHTMYFSAPKDRKTGLIWVKYGP